MRSTDPGATASAWPRWVALAALVVWIPTAMYLTLADSVPRSLHGGLNSWLGHVGIGFAVTVAALWCHRAIDPRASRRARVLVVVASVIFLAGTEAIQGLTSTRSPGAVDLLLDWVGAGLAVVVAVASTRWWPSGWGDRAGPAVVLAAAVVLLGAVAVLPDRASRVGAQPISTTGRCIDHLELSPTEVEPELQASPAPASDRTPLARIDLTADEPTVRGRLDSISLVGNDLTQPATDQGLLFAEDRAVLRSSGPATALTDALGPGQAFTIDVSLRLTELDQTGPARIVTLSDGVRPGNISFQLGVHDGRLSLRVRSACHGSNWILFDELPTTPIHVVVRYDRGQMVLFRNGRVIGRLELVDPDLRTWDPDHQLVIGNETTLNRPVRASIRCVGITDRAQTDDEALALSAQVGC